MTFPIRAKVIYYSIQCTLNSLRLVLVILLVCVQALLQMARRPMIMMMSSSLRVTIQE